MISYLFSHLTYFSYKTIFEKVLEILYTPSGIILVVGAVIILRKPAKFHLFLLFGFCSFVIPWAQENVPKYIKKSKACITQKAEKGKQWMQETKEETQKVLEQNRAPIQEELEKGKTFITQKAEQGKQWIKEQKEELQKVIKKTKAKLEKANEKVRLSTHESLYASHPLVF